MNLRNHRAGIGYASLGVDLPLTVAIGTHTTSGREALTAHTAARYRLIDDQP
jgi:hypothetical protein